MKKLIYIFFFFILVSCKKDKITPPAPDPCIGLQEVSADFLMEEMTSFNENLSIFTDTDTIYSEKPVRFTAKSENAEYTWYIGTEVLHTRSVTRFFNNVLEGQTLPITLVVKKAANTSCFPLDDGYDSIVKFLTVSTQKIGIDSSYLMEGIFRLKEKNRTDSVDITIDVKRDFFQTAILVDIFNYDGNGTNSFSPITSAGYGTEGMNYRQYRFYLAAHRVNLHHAIGGKITLNVIGNDSSFNSYYYTGRKL
jgi:hypothetical protein